MLGNMYFNSKAIISLPRIALFKISPDRRTRLGRFLDPNMIEYFCLDCNWAALVFWHCLQGGL